MSNELVTGVEWMLIGMSVVFAFLILMVISTNLMSKFFTKHFPETPEPLATPSSKADDGAVIAAVIAAAHHQNA